MAYTKLWKWFLLIHSHWRFVSTVANTDEVDDLIYSVRGDRMMGFFNKRNYKYLMVPSTRRISAVNYTKHLSSNQSPIKYLKRSRWKEIYASNRALKTERRVIEKWIIIYVPYARSRVLINLGRIFFSTRSWFIEYFAKYLQPRSGKISSKYIRTVRHFYFILQK